MRQNIMKSTIIWALAVMTVSTAFAQTQASTFIKPVQDELFTEERQPELYCLAQNIYFEAKSEPLAGQYAVADVVLNRVNDTRYPNTICEVVQEGPIKESWKTKQDTTLSDDERIYYPRKNRCQFSWYCDGKADNVRDSDAWRIAQEVAFRIVEEKRMRGITEGATHYHADYVSPKWASKIQLVGSISTHIFYRWQ
jgi:spore germination cell wall hydrolase CwlJ-like protein|tara:strand:+ start:333 stop:920 length:588 start_codon:yes stop_codon:yes gene_type:complete